MPDGSSVFGHCIERLESLHYKVAAGIFSASEVGAPHQRKRVFILAVADSAGERLKGYWSTRLKELHESYNSQLFACGKSEAVWPSRPGEPQHGWEPPRTTGGMENGSRLGRQISSQQSRQNPVQGERQLEGDDFNNQGHGLQKCELEARWKAEKSNDTHSGGDAVSWGKAEWVGDQSHRREQIEQLRLESGICDSGKEQSPCSNDGLELHKGRNESNGEAEQKPSGGDTAIYGTAVCNSETNECVSADHIVDSFWEKVEGLESRVVGNAPHQRRRGLDDESSETCSRQARGHANGTSHQQGQGNWQVEPPLGGDIDGTAGGLGHAELPSLCDSELAEIREWMVKCDNRTDELRLLGNGVCPPTATKAFITLYKELFKYE